MALLGKHFSGIRFLLLTFITVASTVEVAAAMAGTVAVGAASGLNSW